jgi:hypothetical protein
MTKEIPQQLGPIPRSIGGLGSYPDAVLGEDA